MLNKISISIMISLFVFNFHIQNSILCTQKEFFILLQDGYELKPLNAIFWAMTLFMGFVSLPLCHISFWWCISLYNNIYTFMVHGSCVSYFQHDSHWAILDAKLSSYFNTWLSSDYDSMYCKIHFDNMFNQQIFIYGMIGLFLGSPQILYVCISYRKFRF